MAPGCSAEMDKAADVQQAPVESRHHISSITLHDPTGNGWAQVHSGLVMEILGKQLVRITVCICHARRRVWRVLLLPCSHL